MHLPDGFVIVVSRVCETCRELEPCSTICCPAERKRPGSRDGISGVEGDGDLEMPWRLGAQLIEADPFAFVRDGLLLPLRRGVTVHVDNGRGETLPRIALPGPLTRSARWRAEVLHNTFRRTDSF